MSTTLSRIDKIDEQIAEAERQLSAAAERQTEAALALVDNPTEKNVEAATKAEGDKREAENRIAALNVARTKLFEKLKAERIQNERQARSELASQIKSNCQRMQSICRKAEGLQEAFRKIKSEMREAHSQAFNGFRKYLEMLPLTQHQREDIWALMGNSNGQQPMVTSIGQLGYLLSRNAFPNDEAIEAFSKAIAERLDDYEARF